MAKVRLGELLVQMKAVTADQLSGALKYQAQWGTPLGRILIDKHYCEWSHVMSALSKMTGLPLIDLDKQKLDRELGNVLTEKWANQYRTVPIRLEGGRQEVLVVAMGAPATLQTQDAVRTVSGKARLVAHLAPDEAIERGLARIYGSWADVQAAESVERGRVDARELEFTSDVLQHGSAVSSSAPTTFAGIAVSAESLKVLRAAATTRSLSETALAGQVLEAWVRTLKK